MPERRRINEQATADDNIRIAVYDADDLLAIPGWDDLTKRQKLAVLDARDVTPNHVVHSSNTTCIELDEHRVETLNASGVATPVVEEIALGTDDASGTAYTNRSLNSEHARVEITEFIDNGTELLCRVFVARNEANDPNDPTNPVDLVEGGLYAGVYFLNHSTYTAVTKSNSVAAIYEVTLGFNTDTSDA